MLILTSLSPRSSRMLMLAMFPKARRPLTLIVVRPVRRIMLPLTLAHMKVRLALTLAQMKVRPIRMLMVIMTQ